MENCIFCKIKDGKLPSHKIWEDENFYAFLDIKPLNSGHTLIIPKTHYDYIFEMPDEEYTKFLLATKNLAKKLKIAAESKRVGAVVEGFLVPHVHIHLVPINFGNELDPNRAKKMPSEELAKIAEKIRSVS